MVKVKGDGYCVSYDETTGVVTFEGTLRLRDMEQYGPIDELLDEARGSALKVVTVDVRALRFLNSAGITMLFRFVLKMRQQATSQVVVQGADGVPWQGRSLPNLEKLMPELQLVMERVEP
jgi:hypothetical protein